METITRVYAACLAAYNNGKLHGTWIDIDDDTTEESLQAAISAMLATSPIDGAEEWAFHDYDRLPSSLGENPDLATIIETARGIRAHGELFALYMDANGIDAETAESQFDEAYSGAFPNKETFGQQLFTDLGYMEQVPEHLRQYIDTDIFTNDLFLGGDYFEIRHDGESHIFNNNI